MRLASLEWDADGDEYWRRFALSSAGESLVTRPFHIAVASGKGGTGKTTISTNLAVVLADAGIPVTYADCDVEEPNGHIFLEPRIHLQKPVSVPVPAVDASRCTLCGACESACRYSAIVMLPKSIKTFPNLCHGCGGCIAACPEGALSEVPRDTGLLEFGTTSTAGFLKGELNVGEAMAPPVIRAVLKAAPLDRALVIDAPPGTSCPVIESVKSADALLLVTEPTPFGLNDLKLAVAMGRELGVPFGVAVNRQGTGNSEVYDYCAAEGIPILLEIPDDRRIANAYSRGELAVFRLPELRERFLDLFEKLQRLGRRERISIRSPQGKNLSQPGAAFPSGMIQMGPWNEVRELVVVSGKGGTGKTSITASFAALAGQAVVADCDVDAADLHLILNPEVIHTWPFSGGHTAVIDPDRCNGCGICAEHCRFGALSPLPEKSGPVFAVDSLSCEGCGVCVDVCPERAALLMPSLNGSWFVSETRFGPMVHARLGIAQENSGKLVSLVRKEAKAVARSRHCDLVICDGSPGVGCPVIASVTGATFVLIVTEPTLSGFHDLERVAHLCRQMNIEAGFCINKVDINPEIALEMEKAAERFGIPFLGRVRYDEDVTKAQVKHLSIVEYGDGVAARDIRELWGRVQDALA